MSTTNKTLYGVFTDSACPNCKESETYSLYEKTELRKFLFFTLGVKQRTYYKKCTNCLNSYELEERNAQSIIDYKFHKKARKEILKLYAKIFVPFIIIAAVIISIVLLVCSADKYAIKRALADEPDGIYHVYDKDSFFLATVSVVDSIATYDTYAKYEYIFADEYDNLNEDLMEISYYYENDGKFEICMDTDSSELIDARNVHIQYCYYDPELNEEFYYWGVSDYDNILYLGENSAIYYFEYYVSEDEIINYTMHYKKTADYWAELYFIDDESDYNLDFINIYYIDNAVVNRYEHYDFRSAYEISLDEFSSLIESKEISQTLSDLKITPIASTDYEYYANTNIVQRAFVEQLVDGKIICTSVETELKTKGKYYILAEGEKTEY